MVIGPFKYQNIRTKKAKASTILQQGFSKKRLAHPMDRLAANIIDFLVVGMLTGLVTAYFQKEFQLAKLAGEEVKIVFWAFTVFVISFVVGVFYHGVLVSFYSTTIGKSFFKIRVADRLRRKKIRPQQAFLRGLTWWLELALLGIPYLAIFTNPLRRPIHDRVADTICVTSSSRFVTEPTKKESSFVRGILSPVYLVVFVLLFGLVYSFYKQAILEPNWQQELLVNFPSCQSVLEAKKKWIDGESRLQIAMSLYAAEMISIDCLERETQYSFFMEKELPLAYLAKAFIFIDKPALSNEYLEAVCKYGAKSHICEFSKLILNEQESVDSELDRFYNHAKDKDSFAKIWAIKKLVNGHRFEESFALMEKLPETKELASFKWTYEVKALHGMGRFRERDAVYTAVNSYVNDIEEFYIDSYVCQQELFASCNIGSSYCKKFEKSASKDGFDGSLAITTFAKLKQCEKSTLSKFDYLRFSLLSPNTALKDLQSAYYSAYEEKDFSGFVSLLESEEAESDIWYSALFELVELHTSMDKLINYYDNWTSLKKQNQLWYLVGQKLSTKFLDAKRYEQSLAIAREILHFQPKNKSAQKHLVISAHYLGLVDIARRYSKKTSRKIASEKKYKDILHKYGVTP